jgi:NADPH-dependent 2,4-dienoyl-CoA reductase/sulfur reductase-like enzyme
MPPPAHEADSVVMDKQIVILGSGNCGTLVANRLRLRFGRDGYRIVAVDKDDPRGHEVELLVALGLYGPHALRVPEYLQLREDIEFRHVEVGTVDTDRTEVCLMDGTTVHYDALVVASGAGSVPGSPDPGPVGAAYVTRSHRLGDARGFVTVDPETMQSALPGVFAIGGATGVPPSATARGILAQAELLVAGVDRYLSALPGRSAQRQVASEV